MPTSPGRTRASASPIPRATTFPAPWKAWLRSASPFSIRAGGLAARVSGISARRRSSKTTACVRTPPPWSTWRWVIGSSKRFAVSLAAYNLFDSDDNDITYFYESQLPGEGAPVEDRHFHPVEPRTLRLTVETRFVMVVSAGCRATRRIRGHACSVFARLEPGRRPGRGVPARAGFSPRRRRTRKAGHHAAKKPADH